MATPRKSTNFPVAASPVKDAQVIKKANEIISPRVARGGTLSLLGRKVFNVLLYHTQRLGVPGIDAPEGNDVYKTLYWLPLHELARDSAFNSDDAALLKETLLKLQDIKIITDDSKGFSSDVLIASVKIIPGERRTRTMIGWGLHPATEAILRQPEFYTRLSLFYLTSLKTTAGAALYENCKRYATNPSALTRREAWEWWYEVLTGTPITHEKPEYKYFKRDVLKPALAEVAATDIQVELIEHKAGRRVVELQFRIERQAQGKLELPAPPLIDTATIERIVALGVHRREAEDIFAQFETDMLKRTLDLVEKRLSDTKLAALANPAAYFRSALNGKFAVAATPLRAAPKPAVAPKSPPEIDESPEVIAARDARRAALKAFDGLPEAERAAKFESFVIAHPALRAAAVKSPKGRLVREALSSWLLGSKG